MNLPLRPPPGLLPRPAPVAPSLHGLVGAVDEVVAAALSNNSAVLGDEILVVQRQINRLTGALLDRVAAFDAVDGAHEVSGATTASWLRHRTGLPAGQSSDLVRTSRVLRDELPDTHAALRSGELTGQHARTVARTVRKVTDNVRTEHVGSVRTHVEKVMLDVGRSVDVGSLNGFANRVRQIVDPDGVLADANRAHERRWLTVARSIDGMVNIEGLLDPESGATVMTALAAGAVPNGSDDHRSGGQRRADALVELCRQAMDRGEVASSGGVEPHLLVTTSLDTLQHAHNEPAELEWAGPVPPETARRFACDATLTRVLVNPEGMPLDVGRSTRVVPPAIRTALVVRDGGCVAECCDRPPSWTEAHHIRHWIDGGETSLANLVLLCRSHHRKVHEERWTIERVNGRWTLAPP